MTRLDPLASLTAHIQALVAACPQTCLYVLVDGAMLSPEDPDRHVLSERGLSLMPTQAQATPDQYWALPHLIPLTAREVGGEGLTLRTSMRWASEADAASWLASSWARSVLVAALRARLWVQIDERMGAVLRYSDARVLPVLARVLSLEQRTEFFAPLDAWWYMGRSGNIEKLDLAISSAPRPVFAEATLRLDETQQAALQEAAEPDAVAAILRQESPEFLQLQRADRYGFVCRSMAGAKQWNLQSTLALAQYSLMALELGEGFAQTPQWAPLMEDVKAGRLSLAQAAERGGH